MNILFLIIFSFLILIVNGKEPILTDEIIRYQGYPSEEHKTSSQDGFEIVTYRIPSSPFAGAYDVRIPVLLFHSQMTSSAIFVDNKRNRSLAFILSDQGYDVWITNVRGNRYSKGNRFYSDRDSEYWDFSYQEPAIYDLPVLIDYILQVTGHGKLFYIGFSMGATVGFFMLSALPEYNEKLHALIALAPVMYIDNLYNTFQFAAVKMFFTFSTKVWPFNKLLKTVDLQPFAPALKPICFKLILWRACMLVTTAISGDSPSQADGSRYSYYMNHFPDVTSMRTFHHYTQNRGEQFKMYDYGTKKNLIKYQQATPPDLDLGKVTTPVALFSSESDKIATPKDVEILSKKLPNLQYYQPIRKKGFGHASFIWALDAPQILYPKILEFMANKVREFYFGG